MEKLATIFVCIAVSTLLGSIHAFSVLIPEWEGALNGTRAAISFVYSTSLFSLTLAVLFGHHVYRRLSSTQIFMLVALGSGCGLWLSSVATSLVAVYFFYGCIFGSANGLGYGYALQLAGQASERHHALSMSLVTAFYAVGAALASRVFHQVIETADYVYALKYCAITVTGVCLLAAIVTFLFRVSFHSEAPGSKKLINATERRLRKMLWLAYGSSVAAGLMVIGHAYTILASKHPGTESAATAPVLVAVGNVVGGLCVGLVANGKRHNLLLKLYSVLSLASVALVLLPATLGEVFTLLGLFLVGLGYGAIIALYPVVIADVFGKLASPRIYGQVFTAWGIAGLLAPWVSGLLFDSFGNYSASLLLAMLLAGLSLFFLPDNIRPGNN